MLRGITVSALVHGTVLAMAVISWPQPRSECDQAIERLRREEPGISAIEIVMRLPQCATSSELPIDFIEIARVADLAEMRRTETPDPEPAPAPPEEAPPAPPPEPAPEPEPEPEPEVVIPDEETPPPPEPEPKPEPPKPEPPRPQPPRPRPPEPRPRNDLDFLDDFDRALQDRRATEQRPRQTAQAEDRPALPSADRDRAGAGERRGQTASLQAALRRQIGECWRGVDDFPKEHQINVVLRVTLDQNGGVVGDPQIVSPRPRPVGRSGVAVDLAVRAVNRCSPYRLPPADYEFWRDIEVTIGPADGT